MTSGVRGPWGRACTLLGSGTFHLGLGPCASAFCLQREGPARPEAKLRGRHCPGAHPPAAGPALGHTAGRRVARGPEERPFGSTGVTSTRRLRWVWWAGRVPETPGMVPVPTQTGPQCPRAAGGWSRAKAAEWGSLKVRSLRDRFKVAGSGRAWGHQPCPLFWTQREASPGPGSAPSPGDLPTARCPWPGRTWLTSSGATPSSLPGRGPSPAAWPPRTRPACGRLPGPVPQDSPPPDRGALWPPSCSSLWDQGGLVACRQVGDKSPPDPGSPGSRRLRSRSDPPRHPAPPRPPAPRRQWNARGRDPRSAPPPPFPAVPGRPGGVSIQGSQGQGAGGRDRQRAGDARGKRAASPVRTPGPPASGSSSSARAASPGMAWPCARPSVRVPPCVRPVEPGRPPPLARDRGGGVSG